jgi:LmbE family N-acetylglucosaminyl deacetylase
MFDPAAKKWSDRWGVFCFEFHTEGTFSQLEKIRIEKSERRHGFATYYVWVLGKPNVRILVDSTLDAKKAAMRAERLSTVLELPSAKITVQSAA